jgi:hypothetical protein
VQLVAQLLPFRHAKPLAQVVGAGVLHAPPPLHIEGGV